MNAAQILLMGVPMTFGVVLARIALSQRRSHEPIHATVRRTPDLDSLAALRRVNATVTHHTSQRAA